MASVFLWQCRRNANRLDAFWYMGHENIIYRQFAVTVTFLWLVLRDGFERCHVSRREERLSSEDDSTRLIYSLRNKKAYIMVSRGFDVANMTSKYVHNIMSGHCHEKNNRDMPEQISAFPFYTNCNYHYRVNVWKYFVDARWLTKHILRLNNPTGIFFSRNHFYLHYIHLIFSKCRIVLAENKLVLPYNKIVQSISINCVKRGQERKSDFII